PGGSCTAPYPLLRRHKGGMAGVPAKRGVIRAEAWEALPVAPGEAPRCRHARHVLTVLLGRTLAPEDSPAFVIFRSLKKVLWSDKKPTTMTNRLGAALEIDRAKSRG